MRALTLACLLPLAAMAQADGDSAPADRSLLRRTLIPSDEACPTWVNSQDFRVARGEATGTLHKNAIARARQDGVHQLSATLCQGQETSPRCLAALRGIAPLGPGEWRKRGLSGWACASVAIETRVLNAQERELDTLADDIGELAQAVRAAAGAAPVQLLAPRWQDTGCPAGEVGPHLLNLLRQRLVGLTLVDAGQPAPQARQVRLDLSMAGGRVAVAPVIRPPTEVGWTPLDTPAITFAADLFQLREDDARVCPTEDALRLPGGQRLGPDGLRVQLFAASPDGMFCDGEPLTPRVELSAPARLRVYTVQADGQGFAVWPFQAQDDRVYTPAAPPTLPPFTATRTFDGSDSRLVVAAFPADSDDLPPAAFCRLSAPLDVSSLKGAAVDSATWHVAAAGERLCLHRGDAAVAAQERAHAQAAVAQASTCLP